MINQQLLDYIRQQLNQGTSREQITSSLIANGWLPSDVNEAFVALPLNPSPAPQAPISQPVLVLPGAMAIFGQAWSLYKQRLGTFLGIMMAPLFFAVVFWAVLIGGGVFGPKLFPSLLTVGKVVSLVVYALILLVVFVVSFIFQIWGQIALIFAIKDSKEKIGIKEAYRRSWHKILSYVWVVLLFWSVLMGGFILLLVPGIIFTIWFSLAMFVLISEDLRGMNALLKSKEYVKGMWGKVFWRFFFIGIIFMAVSLVSFILFKLLNIPYGTEISRLLVGLFFMPLMTVYSFMVYSNIRSIKGEIVLAPAKGKKAIFYVIAILGLLIIPATFLLSAVLYGARAKAQDMRKEADLRQIQLGLEVYRVDNGFYPFSLEEISKQYLPTIPVDPKTKLPYQYLKKSDVDYQICAQMEVAKTQKCLSPKPLI